LNSQARVVVTDFLTEPLEIEREILGDLADVVALEARTADDLRGRVSDADALLVYHFVQIDRSVLDELKRCRLIVRCGAGVDNVDCAHAAQLGIAVANVPDYGSEEVADTAIGALLTLARGTHFLNQRCRRPGELWSYALAAPLERLRGRVLGIIGLGRIGTAAALRGKALGLDVVFYDPYLPSGHDKALGIRCADSLEELLAQSHIVSLHCPLTDETHHMIDVAAFAAIPSRAIIINTARGGVVDAGAVLRGLENGHLLGAALDVLEREPPSEDDPLLVAWRNPEHPAHDRLLLTPHAAFYCEQGLLEMRRKGSENCRRILLGKAPRNVVNSPAAFR
jgi:D-3-phosphoglycerate dehydrogenase/C-terminal binding protein